LQVFERVLEHRSLSAASKELHLAQPTVTRAIQELEKVLGAPLFERTSRGVVPTELGQVVGRRARQWLAEVRYLADEVDAVLGGAAGHVAVGTLISASARLLPAALARLMTLHPGIQTSITESPSRQLFPALARGELDIIVGRLPDADADEAGAPAGQIAHHPLYQEDLCLLARPRHPLAGAPRVDLDQLQDGWWILPTPASPLRQSVEQVFRDADLPLPRHRLESLSLQTNLGLLQRTDAVALLPHDAARPWIKSGLLCRLALDAFGRFGRVGYSVSTLRAPSPACLALIDCLHRAAGEPG
ncbi:MAG: LysR family transcriptional regulator, partial [Pigmentiphaga sp.]